MKTGYADYGWKTKSLNLAAWSPSRLCLVPSLKMHSGKLGLEGTVMHNKEEDTIMDTKIHGQE